MQITGQKTTLDDFPRIIHIELNSYLGIKLNTSFLLKINWC